MPEETKEWEWDYLNGVHLYEAGNVVWYEKETSVRFASGAACSQTYEDFLAKGPCYGGKVPPEILQAVTEAVRKRVAQGRVG